MYLDLKQLQPIMRRPRQTQSWQRRRCSRLSVTAVCLDSCKKQREREGEREREKEERGREGERERGRERKRERGREGERERGREREIVG